MLSVQACRKPAPLDIEIPQDKPAMVISSFCPNNRAVFIAAGYSINSSVNIDSVISGTRDVPAGMMIESARVTIEESGVPATLANLTAIRKGIYGNTDVLLKPGQSYKVTIADDTKGITTSATTTYMPQPQVSKLTPERVIKNGDTVFKLHFAIENVAAEAHYYVSYTTSSARKKAGTSKDIDAVHDFEAKKISLYSSADVVNNTINKTITLTAKANDTLHVEVARIEDGYRKYLEAYIKTGYLVNQLTGEPVNLPTNLSNGHGYFTLHNPRYATFDLDNLPLMK